MRRTASHCISAAVPRRARRRHANPLLCVSSLFHSFASRCPALLSKSLAMLFLAFPLHRVSLLCESFAGRVESLLFQCVSYLALQFRCTSQRLQSQQCRSYSEQVHCLTLQHFAIPTLLTSGLFRCDSLRFGAFPTLFGSYPLLCVANQYHAQAILCCAKLCSSFASQCYANAKLGSSLPLHFTARLFLRNAPLGSAYAMLRSSMQFCSLAFQFYATAARGLSSLFHRYARPFDASLLPC